jgi:hypothetical protein
MTAEESVLPWSGGREGPASADSASGIANADPRSEKRGYTQMPGFSKCAGRLESRPYNFSDDAISP